MITLSGHSAGGRRNYISLMNSQENQYSYYDPNDGQYYSNLQVVSYGAPVNNIDLEYAALTAGATYLGQFNNQGDFVGNFLGANGNVTDFAYSTAGAIALFEPPFMPNYNYLGDMREYKEALHSKKNNNILIKPLPFNTIYSPHSNYNRSSNNENYLLNN